jgi:hypothetical protein
MDSCSWPVDGIPCDGEVASVCIMSGQLTVDMCANHLSHHKCIMALHTNGYKIEDVLNQTPKWREQEIAKLNIDLTTVKL